MLLLNRRRYMHASNDVIMTSATNPEVLAICYAQGWCASADKMTLEEAQAVTNIGQAFRGSGIVHFDEFQYFTGVTSLTSFAFFNCTSLTSIVLPTSVVSLGMLCLANCKLITALDFSNVTTFGTQIAQGCTALADVTLPSGATTLGTSMFVNCTSLVSIDLPSTLTAIPNYCFSGCTNLVLTELPSGVTTIGNSAFQSVRGITKLTLPSGVTSIDTNGFFYALNLSTLTCLATTAPTIQSDTFDTMGAWASTRTLRVPSGATGYDQGYWLDLQTRASYPFTIEYI